MARILIAEDEAHIARVLSIWLTRHGHLIFIAENGEAALEILDVEPIDLIISDMNMPKMNGIELVAAVREERHLDVPFILLTARCDQVELGRTLQPYSVRLYRKPFVPSRLVADIDEMLKPAATS